VVPIHFVTIMKAFSPYSRPSDDAFQQASTRPPIAAEGHSPAGPSVREVLSEIGITLAVHLAVALAIVLALRAYGIV
jgi:hypothetical protein